MVAAEESLYLLVGEPTLAKDDCLNRIKGKYLKPATKEFNFDCLDARRLGLKELQERLLLLPVKAAKRLIIIRGAEELSQQVRDYLLEYAAEPAGHIVLVLDINALPRRGNAAVKSERLADFLRAVSRYGNALRFDAPPKPDTFTLSRQIELRRAAGALRILKQLLQEGQRPERILGGLRYACEGSTFGPRTLKKLKALFNCDVDIKTGRLPAWLALERLVVRLCYL